ncbi:hypothetical protein [Burkholderia sp. 9120]|uniref:hypothetical protein n=1 Tax=Burkholderia sp. 9120 TaxID=1500897 RepID=UPI0012E01867|nr:hypothetical protein [Burkholderia sp. 9120]
MKHIESREHLAAGDTNAQQPVFFIPHTGMTIADSEDAQRFRGGGSISVALAASVKRPV